MKTLYLAGPIYTTLTIELDATEARIVGWGLGAGDFFGLALTDTERMLLAAALLREGESVKGGDVSEVTATSKNRR